MNERIVPTDPQQADEHFVARLLLGSLTEHELRLTAVRLLRCDDRFRAAVVSNLEPFEAFDADLAAEYDQVLRETQPSSDVAARRCEILERAFARAPDLDQLLRHLTYSDFLTQGKVGLRIFTWSMAEHLLERARRPGLSKHEVKASLYLALMVIDGVEILGAARRLPGLFEMMADVRRRISEAADLGAAPSRRK